MADFEKLLPRILKALKTTYGQDFYSELTLQFHHCIAADYTFIARLDTDRYISQTLCLVAKGKLVDNFAYSLKDTPCADVTADNICIYPQNICHIFPKDKLLVDMNIEGYVGIPLHDSTGKVFGLIVGLYENKITNHEFVVTLFELFSGRISAEIERTEHEKELEELTKNLEVKVNQRTESLSLALKHLQLTQEEIVEKEKLASLGGIVAGVAHEINTPIGNSILGASIIEETTEKLYQKVLTGNISKKELATSLEKISQSVGSLNSNLHRASELVQYFKQIAVEQDLDEFKVINITQWLQVLLNSMMPILRKNNITIETFYSASDIILISSTSRLVQVFSNLINNIATHAFPDDFPILAKRVLISVFDHEDKVTIIVSDNGKGIDKSIEGKLFEPFYTTNRAQGSTGLGLSIIHNIIVGTLKGSIEVNINKKDGCEFIINLSKSLESASH